jgi:hypothetical protein
MGNAVKLPARLLLQWIPYLLKLILRTTYPGLDFQVGQGNTSDASKSLPEQDLLSRVAHQ